jgi:hypothetical protein
MECQTPHIFGAGEKGWYFRTFVISPAVLQVISLFSESAGKKGVPVTFDANRAAEPRNQNIFDFLSQLVASRLVLRPLSVQTFAPGKVDCYPLERPMKTIFPAAGDASRVAAKEDLP